jgi:hypothetical protein
LLTTFCVTTTTSLSSSGELPAINPAAISDTRLSPGRTSGMPSTPMIRIPESLTTPIPGGDP